MDTAPFNHRCFGTSTPMQGLGDIGSESKSIGVKSMPEQGFSPIESLETGTLSQRRWWEQRHLESLRQNLLLCLEKDCFTTLHRTDCQTAFLVLPGMPSLSPLGMRPFSNKQGGGYMHQGFHLLTLLILHPPYYLTRSTLHILSMSLQLPTLLLTLLGHLYTVCLLSTDVFGWKCW